MVSNESLGHNLSNAYKIYALYAGQNFAEAKNLPLPLLKLRKKAIFWSKSPNKVLNQVTVWFFLYQTCEIYQMQ